jgi:putative transposase
VIVAGGRYHVVNRGYRRDAIFRTDTGRRRFPGRVAELPERLLAEVQASVLMDNHYHLLRRLHDANPSDAIRWLQVSYSSAFHRAHRIRGRRFQGRVRSLFIEERNGVVEVAMYLAHWRAPARGTSPPPPGGSSTPP